MFCLLYTSKAVIESVDNELKPDLDRRMRPEMYGHANNRIIINCSYSYYDHDHCKTNYFIAAEKLKLKQNDCEDNIHSSLFLAW